jgi:bifunctional non-homologous end joining protein LigD
VAASSRASRASCTGSKELPALPPTLPLFVPPQLPTLAAKPPGGLGWLHEIKRDGYRVLVRLDGADVRLFTRSGYDWTARYGAIQQHCRQLGARGTLIDGEILIQRQDGTCDFAAMQDAVSRGCGAFVLFAFDVLWLDGRDLRELPLVERKALLLDLMAKPCADAAFPLRYADHLEGEGGPVFKRACQLGLEGIVSKRARSHYRSGRSREWLKVKNFERSDLVVIGCVRQPGRPEEMLLAKTERQGAECARLCYVGRAFNAVHGAERERLAAMLERTARTTAPISGLRVPGAIWTEPKHRVKVRHLATTGTLRHAIVEGLSK